MVKYTTSEWLLQKEANSSARVTTLEIIAVYLHSFNVFTVEIETQRVNISLLLSHSAMVQICSQLAETCMRLYINSLIN